MYTCLSRKYSLIQSIFLSIFLSIYLSYYSYIYLSSYLSREWVEKRTGKTSVPQIFFNSTYVGGNHELQASSLLAIL